MTGTLDWPLVLLYAWSALAVLWAGVWARAALEAARRLQAEQRERERVQALLADVERRQA
jgi:hypothetical protein